MNKNLPYYDIIMRAPMVSFVVPDLPDGYRFKSYEDGDERYWCELECEVHEFTSVESAMAYFSRVFIPYKERLSERMFFIIDPLGRYVATASAWFKDDDQRHYALLHWVSCSPKVQGKGLGNAIVAFALSHFPTLEPNEEEIFLHTQTWSYKAIALYHKFGFCITDVPLINTKTDSQCQSVLETVLPVHITNTLYEKNGKR